MSFIQYCLNLKSTLGNNQAKRLITEATESDQHEPITLVLCMCGKNYVNTCVQKLTSLQNKAEILKFVNSQLIYLQTWFQKNYTKFRGLTDVSRFLGANEDFVKALSAANAIFQHSGLSRFDRGYLTGNVWDDEIKVFDIYKSGFTGHYNSADIVLKSNNIFLGVSLKKIKGSYENPTLINLQLKSLFQNEELIPIQQQALDILDSKISDFMVNSFIADTNIHNELRQFVSQYKLQSLDNINKNDLKFKFHNYAVKIEASLNTLLMPNSKVEFGEKRTAGKTILTAIKSSHALLKTQAKTLGKNAKTIDDLYNRIQKILNTKLKSSETPLKYVHQLMTNSETREIIAKLLLNFCFKDDLISFEQAGVDGKKFKFALVIGSGTSTILKQGEYIPLSTTNTILANLLSKGKPKLDPEDIDFSNGLSNAGLDYQIIIDKTPIIDLTLRYKGLKTYSNLPEFQAKITPQFKSLISTYQ